MKALKPFLKNLGSKNLELFTEGCFNKDLERAIRRGKDISKLEDILILLVQNKSLPKKNRNHKLQGIYKDYWECHIAPDWLLIYKKTKTEIIVSRTGSHSDLF